MPNQNFSKFLNKGISTPIGILIIVLVAIVAVGVLFWQLDWTPKKEVEIPKVEMPEEKAKDETADWKTYRNDEYGNYIIQYPQEWQINLHIREQEKKSFVAIWYVPPGKAYIEEGGVSFYLTCKEGEDRGFVSSAVPHLYSLLIGESITSEFEPFTSGHFSGIKIPIKDTIKIEGYTGWTRGVCFIDGHIFNKKYENQVMQMLSTFKFLE